MVTAIAERRYVQQSWRDINIIARKPLREELPVTAVMSRFIGAHSDSGRGKLRHRYALFRTFRFRSCGPPYMYVRGRKLWRY